MAVMNSPIQISGGVALVVDPVPLLGGGQYTHGRYRATTGQDGLGSGCSARAVNRASWRCWASITFGR